MKALLSSVIIAGLIAMYFMTAAFHVNYFEAEMLVHSTVRFMAGFVFLGIWVWYKHRLKLKAALYSILFLLVLDDIIDYIRDINNLRFEMVIHDSFMVVWGALVGFLVMIIMKRGIEKLEEDVIKS